MSTSRASLPCVEETDSASSAPIPIQTTEQHDFDAIWRSQLDGLKIRGNANRTLFGASLVGCVAVATAVLLASTRNHLKDRMPLLAVTVASSALVTAPNLAGSLIRLPASIALERWPSWVIHAVVMGISMVGTFSLMILSFATASFEVLDGSIFAAYMVFGLMGGFGVGLFSPGIATVSFWHPRSKQGSKNGIFGGVTNLAPGLFGLWIGPVMTETSIGLTYVIWLVLGALVMAISLPQIYDSPFHQMLFFSRKLAAEHKVQLTQDQIDEIREIAIELHGQEIFPSGHVRVTLASSAQNYRTWQLVSLYIVSYGGYLGLTVYLPTFFTDAYDVTASFATVLASIFSLTAGVMRIFGGWLCDKISFMDGGVLMNYVSFTLIMIGSIVVVFAPSVGGGFTGVTFMSIGCGTSNAATFKILPRYIHTAVAGAAGWVGAMGALGSVIWPIFMGIISSRFPHRASFLLFLGLGLGALLMMISVHMQLLTEDLRETREEAERCARKANFANARSRSLSQGPRKISTTNINASPTSQSRVNVGGVDLNLESLSSAGGRKNGAMNVSPNTRCEGDATDEQCFSDPDGTRARVPVLSDVDSPSAPSSERGRVVRERVLSVDSRTGLISSISNVSGIEPSFHGSDDVITTRNIDGVDDDDGYHDDTATSSVVSAEERHGAASSCDDVQRMTTPEEEDVAEPSVSVHD